MMVKTAQRITALSIVLAFIAIWMPPSHAHQTGVEALLSEKVRAAAALNEDARELLLTTSKNPAFTNYFTAHDPATRDSLRDALERHTIAVATAYSADEVCLIDPFGREITRVVHSHAATDLSESESGQLFFRPGFATPAGEVYTSPPYISEDTQSWVLGFTTLIMAEGRKKAILHLERNLKHLQDILYAGVKDDLHFIVAIDDDGWIVADSRKDIAHEGDLSKPFPGAYFERLVLAGLDFKKLVKAVTLSKGRIKTAGKSYYVAYQRVGTVTLFAFEAADG